MRRKLFSIALAYMAGIVIGSLILSANFVIVLIISALIFCLCVRSFGIGKECAVALICGLLMFLLFTYHFEMTAVNDYVGQNVEIKGVVVDAEKGTKGKKSYVCKIEEIYFDEDVCEKTKGTIIFRDKENKIPFSNSSGAIVRFKCTITKPTQAENPNMFNYRRYLYSRGISFIGENVTIIKLEESNSVFYRAKNKIMSLRENFLDSISDEGLRAILESVIFGCSKALSEDIYYIFQMNGTAHVLAVSGLHIGVLYGCYAALKKKTGLRILTPIFVGFLLVYGTCAMWAVSVKRAVALILLKLIAVQSDRPFDLLTSTAAAALIICVRNPYVLFSAGFQLSFLAVCILAFVPRAVERISLSGISGAVIIQVMLAPYICYVFNYFSISGFIANIPVIFLISIFVPLGILYFLIYSLIGSSVPIFERLLDGIGNLIIETNNFFYFDGKGSFDVASRGVFIIVLVYLAIFFFTSENFSIDCLRKKGKIILGKTIALVLVAVLVFGCSYGLFGAASKNTSACAGDFEKSDFVFLDISQGECMHVKLGVNTDILIDGGGRVDYNTGRKVIKSYLLRNGVKDIDASISSILDQRHYLGLFQLSGCFDVNRNLVWAKAGDRIEVEKDCWVEVLWPETINTEELNSADNRRVIKVCCEGISCIVYGGLDKKNEDAFLEKYCETDVLSCDIVKISMPQFGNVSVSDFLTASDADYAVVSCSGLGEAAYNEMIENIERKDIIFYRTDLLGAVGFIIDKEKISVCTQQKNMLLRHLLKN